MDGKAVPARPSLADNGRLRYPADLRRHIKLAQPIDPHALVLDRRQRAVVLARQLTDRFQPVIEKPGAFLKV